MLFMITKLTRFDKFKAMIIGAVSLVFLSVFAPIFQTSVQASQVDDVDNIELTAEEEAKVDEVAEQLEFIYEKAATKDSEGYIIDIDFDMIEDEYGEFEEIAEFRAYMKQRKQLRSSWTDCMVDAIVDFYGLAGLGAVGSSIVGYIKTKSWTAAAKILVGTFGAKIAVPALAAQLVYYSGKCAR